MTSQEAYAILRMRDSDSRVFHPRRELLDVLGKPVFQEIISDDSKSYQMGWRKRAREGLRARFVFSDSDWLWLIGEIEMRDGEIWIVDGRLAKYPPQDWKPKPGDLTEAGRHELERRQCF